MAFAASMVEIAARMIRSRGRARRPLAAALAVSSLLAAGPSLADGPTAPPPTAPAASDADAERLEALHAESLHTRRVLADAVLLDGIAGLVGGGVLVVPDGDDQAWRYAGANTLLFGAINLVVGLRALIGIGHEELTWSTDSARAARRTPEGLAAARMHAAHDEQREAIGHALNLGLDLAYLGVGGAAVFASESGVSHPLRWRASGIAIGIQSLVLVAIDLVGVVDSRGYHERLIHEFAPSVTFAGVGRDRAVTFGWQGRF